MEPQKQTAPATLAEYTTAKAEIDLICNNLYKSVRARAIELEKENTELKAKLATYEVSASNP